MRIFLLCIAVLGSMLSYSQGIEITAPFDKKHNLPTTTTDTSLTLASLSLRTWGKGVGNLVFVLQDSSHYYYFNESWHRLIDTNLYVTHNYLDSLLNAAIDITTADFTLYGTWTHEMPINANNGLILDSIGISPVKGQLYSDPTGAWLLYYDGVQVDTANKPGIGGAGTYQTLGYVESTRVLSISDGNDITLPLAQQSIPGLVSTTLYDSIIDISLLSHDSVDFTGPLDYITRVGAQLFELGQIDLSTDVTGLLPIINGGTNSRGYYSGGIVYYNGDSLATEPDMYYDVLSQWLVLPRLYLPFDDGDDEYSDAPIVMNSSKMIANLNANYLQSWDTNDILAHLSDSIEDFRFHIDDTTIHFHQVDIDSLGTIQWVEALIPYYFIDTSGLWTSWQMDSLLATVIDITTADFTINGDWLFNGQVMIDLTSSDGGDSIVTWDPLTKRLHFTGPFISENQTITLSEDVSGTGKTEIAVTVIDDSHNHTGATISGLTVLDFESQNISQWTNDAGYLTSIGAELDPIWTTDSAYYTRQDKNETIYEGWTFQDTVYLTGTYAGTETDSLLTIDPFTGAIRYISIDRLNISPGSFEYDTTFLWTWNDMDSLLSNSIDITIEDFYLYGYWEFDTTTVHNNGLIFDSTSIVTPVAGMMVPSADNAWILWYDGAEWDTLNPPGYSGGVGGFQTISWTTPNGITLSDGGGTAIIPYANLVHAGLMTTGAYDTLMEVWDTIPYVVSRLHDTVLIIGSLDYITQYGQILTLDSVNASTDINGLLPIKYGGTNSRNYYSGGIVYYNGDSLATEPDMYYDVLSQWLVLPRLYLPFDDGDDEFSDAAIVMSSTKMIANLNSNYLQSWDTNDILSHLSDSIEDFHYHIADTTIHFHQEDIDSLGTIIWVENQIGFEFIDTTMFWSRRQMDSLLATTLDILTEDFTVEGDWSFGGKFNLTNLPSGALTDSLVTIDFATGEIRRVNLSDLAISGVQDHWGDSVVRTGYGISGNGLWATPIILDSATIYNYVREEIHDSIEGIIVSQWDDDTDGISYSDGNVGIGMIAQPDANLRVYGDLGVAYGNSTGTSSAGWLPNMHYQTLSESNLVTSIEQYNSGITISSSYWDIDSLTTSIINLVPAGVSIGNLDDGGWGGHYRFDVNHDSISFYNYIQAPLKTLIKNNILVIKDTAMYYTPIDTGATSYVLFHDLATGKITPGSVNNIFGGTGSMVYPSAGIPISTGSAWEDNPWDLDWDDLTDSPWTRDTYGVSYDSSVAIGTTTQSGYDFYLSGTKGTYFGLTASGYAHYFEMQPESFSSGIYGTNFWENIYMGNATITLEFGSTEASEEPYYEKVGLAIEDDSVTLSYYKFILSVPHNNAFSIFGDSSRTYKPIQYDSDLSTLYTDRSLVDKEYVDNLVGTPFTWDYDWDDLTDKSWERDTYGVTYDSAVGIGTASSSNYMLDILGDYGINWEGTNSFLNLNESEFVVDIFNANGDFVEQYQGDDFFLLTGDNDFGSGDYSSIDMDFGSPKSLSLYYGDAPKESRITLKEDSLSLSYKNASLVINRISLKSDGVYSYHSDTAATSYMLFYDLASGKITPGSVDNISSGTGTDEYLSAVSYSNGTRDITFDRAVGSDLTLNLPFVDSITTAYLWGNHADEGYLTGNESITLSGDITGTGATSITTTLGNDVVDDACINWGFGVGQVGASDIPYNTVTLNRTLPMVSSSGYFTTGVIAGAANTVLQGQGVTANPSFAQLRLDQLANLTADKAFSSAYLLDIKSSQNLTSDVKGVLSIESTAENTNYGATLILATESATTSPLTLIDPSENQFRFMFPVMEEDDLILTLPETTGTLALTSQIPTIVDGSITNEGSLYLVDDGVSDTAYLASNTSGSEKVYFRTSDGIGLIIDQNDPNYGLDFYLYDDSITESKLSISNAPIEGGYLSYKDGADQLTWIAGSEIPKFGGIGEGTVNTIAMFTSIDATADSIGNSSITQFSSGNQIGIGTAAVSLYDLKIVGSDGHVLIEGETPELNFFSDLGDDESLAYIEHEAVNIEFGTYDLLSINVAYDARSTGIYINPDQASAGDHGFMFDGSGVYPMTTATKSLGLVGKYWENGYISNLYVDEINLSGGGSDVEMDGSVTKFGVFDADTILKFASDSLILANLFADYDETGDSLTFGMGIKPDYIIQIPVTSSHTFSGTKRDFISDVTCGLGDAMYVYSSGNVRFADADAISSVIVAGIALESGSANGSIALALPGSEIYNADWNWTVGGAIYITVTGTTTNTLNQTAPSTAGDFVVIVGYATTADSFMFTGFTAPVEI